MNSSYRFATWAELRETLQDISEEATEAVRRLTAESRALWREEQAWKAAREFFSGKYSVSPELDKHAGALCFLEMHGLYGGGFKKPGSGTTRHRAFRNLGKGRRNAEDGRSWTESITRAWSRRVWSYFTVTGDKVAVAMEFKEEAFRAYDGPVTVQEVVNPENEENFDMIDAHIGAISHAIQWFGAVSYQCMNPSFREAVRIAAQELNILMRRRKEYAKKMEESAHVTATD